ncbi:NAD(P)-binding protein, partial [Shewanella sp.]|uniref:NAD(P)-binding protein n=1 Tax=Shewanella sp. TaxID=50422 RepID=UPI0040549D4F
MNKNNAWDAVCIGSGITSLAFCAQVTKIDPNAKLLVLEKHVVPGGYATLFTRPRKTDAYFDCSMHKISGSQLNGGNFRRLFDEMELGRDLELIEHP